MSLLASLLVAVYFIPCWPVARPLESQTRVEPVERRPIGGSPGKPFAGLPQVLSFLALGVVALGCARLLLGWVLECLAKGAAGLLSRSSLHGFAVCGL